MSTSHVLSTYSTLIMIAGPFPGSLLSVRHFGASNNILFRFIQKNSLIILQGKNRRSELGRIWDSKSGHLWGNFFAGLFAGHLGPTSFSLATLKKPRKRNRAEENEVFKFQFK